MSATSLPKFSAGHILPWSFTGPHDDAVNGGTFFTLRDAAGAWIGTVRTRPLAGHASGCGTLLSADTLGVSHPVLPCGARIFVRYGRKTVLTEVVDRGPIVSGRQFEVTPALADLLGLTGVQPIRWSFARAG